MSNKVDLKDLFKSLQDELSAKLNVNNQITHGPTKGDDTELNWIDALKSLPSRYVVDKGFVIDSKGNRSEQIDIVIYDRYYSPLILRRESTLYIPAESVYAVLEVKQDLSKEFIESAGAKALSVRLLERTSLAVRQIDGSYKSRTLPPILAGIVAGDSSWSPPFGDAFEGALKGLDAGSHLDLGIALRNGSFDLSKNESGAIVIRHSEADDALVSFFMNLTKRLQKLGNAPGIDLDEYYKGYEQ